MREQWRLERDYPLTDEFLAVCHAWRSPAGTLRVAIKGAPETVLPLCGRMDAMAEVARATETGLRLLAVAEAEASAPLPDDPRRIAFRFAGFVRLADPLRASVPEAVAQCRRAGIRVVMITGDFPGTALNIARQAGIDAGEALSGDQVAALDDAALAAAVRRVNVFARVRPEQKLRLVQAYRAAGEVVAMTGDGVNDAPALKAAHIGIAMGSRGTDVAREAAALVLLEDDFGSIVRTVRLGRRIYENIRNAMRYLVSVHVPIAGMAFLPVELGGPLFLYPVHVVFLEFVIDPACTLVYEAERTEAGAMERPPRDPREPILARRHWWAIAGYGALITAAVLAALFAALHGLGYRDERAVTVSFLTLAMAQLWHVFTMRDRGSDLLRNSITRNPWVWGALALCAGLLAAAVYLPGLGDVLGVDDPGPAGWGLALGCSLAPFAVGQVLRSRRHSGGNSERSIPGITRSALP